MDEDSSVLTCCQLHCAKNILCSQCLSRMFLKEVSVPAYAILDGKINKLLITLLAKKVCILISKIFLHSLKGCPLVPVNSFSLKLNKEQTVSLRNIKAMYNFKCFNHITSFSSVFQAW